MKDRRFTGILLIILAVILGFSMVARQRVHNEQQKLAEAKAEAEAEAIRLANEERAAEEERLRLEEEEREREASADPNQIFSFSKEEKNVVLIMLDRALSCYFPYIMEEMPDVKKQFDGFVYYPNTLSFGSNTIYGVPAVYGGYEYTPEAMNARQHELLVDKHNEALKMMPKLFSDHGYRVVVCDPAIAGYSWTPDLSIFDGMENVRAFNFLAGADSEGSGLSQYQKFMKNYDFLNSLPEKTNNKAKSGTYIAIDNEMTHRYLALNWPDYEPSPGSVDRGPLERSLADGSTITLSTYTQISHYHANACALKLLGRWFDYLRKLDVFDNTRIIIAADHGYGVGQFRSMFYGQSDLLYYNPLFLVKDFNSSEPVKTDHAFMTNADVPVTAVSGLIENAANPYTGKLLSETVNKEEVHVNIGTNWRVEYNTGVDFGGYWFFVVKNNIFDVNNWTTTHIYPQD